MTATALTHVLRVSDASAQLAGVWIMFSRANAVLEFLVFSLATARSHCDVAKLSLLRVPSVTHQPW